MTTKRPVVLMGIVVITFLLAPELRVTRAFHSAERALAPESDTETKEAKIARALSAGPEDVAQRARVVDTDSSGTTVILREGTNGFTCMPGNPKIIGDPPMCADEASMQGAADFKARKPKPSTGGLRSQLGRWAI